jgi:hypothetical protein
MTFTNLPEKERLSNLLKFYQNVAAEHKVAHHKASRRNLWLNNALQITSIALAVFVGGTLFSTLSVIPSWSIFLAIASFVSATLGMIIIFLRPGEKCAAHKSFTSNYSSIEREIAIELSASLGEKKLRTLVENYNKELNELSKHAPLVKATSHEVILWQTR